MFALQSNISIGEFRRVKPHEVRVTKSIFDFIDRATIKLPITSRIKRAGEVITASAETAKLFSEGDAVSIQLGYNGILRDEFKGFVSRLNFTSPLEIECEGYSYQLRKRTYKRTFVRTELIEVLKYLAEGTGISVDEENIPSFVIEKLLIQEHSGLEVLEMIRKISHGTVQAYFRGNVLFAGLLFQDARARRSVRPAVRYRIGWNVIKDGNLKLRQAKNQAVTVNFVGLKNDGSRTQAKAGDTFPRQSIAEAIGSAGSIGESKIFKSFGVVDPAALSAMAAEKHTSLSYDGYEGKITAFLQPYCQPGDRAALEDTRYHERSGTYLVESIEVTFGTGGARRVVGIGLKL